MRLFFLLLFLISLCWSCQPDYKQKLIGQWETVKYECFINGVKSPKSDFKVHWNFREDHLIQITSRSDFPDTSEYKVTKDSIITGEGLGGCRYSFNGDTLLLCDSFIYDNCEERFELCLLKISYDQFGDFSEKHKGIEGDWSGTESYIYHPDSVSKQSIKHFHSSHNDLYITEDSIYQIEYIWHLGHQSSYSINGDSLTVLNKKKEYKNYHYSIQKDTLIFEMLKEDDYILHQEFVRTDYDQGEINYLIENWLNPEFLQGRWHLSINEQDSVQFLQKYPDYRFLKELSFNNLCVNQSIRQLMTIEKDIISVEENNIVNQFKFITSYQSGGCIISREIILSPIIDGNPTKIWLRYWQ